MSVLFWLILRNVTSVAQSDRNLTFLYKDARVMHQHCMVQSVVIIHRVWKKGATLFSTKTLEFLGRFLQRGRIACNAERCNGYGNSVRLSVRPSVCHTLVSYPDE